MIVAQSTSGSDAVLASSGSPPSNTRGGNPARNWKRFLDPAIFAFLLLFAVALPHSIKGAERGWKIAFGLWLLKLVADRTRPFSQPLAAPLLAYVVLSAISTALSPDPYLSWDRMKFVCLFLVGIVVAQNVKRISQVRCLVLFLVFSGFAAALFTGWQYAYGVGVRIQALSPSSRLARVGLDTGYIVTRFSGHAVRTPDQLVQAVKSLPSGIVVPVEYIFAQSPQPNVLSITPGDFLQSGLGTPALLLARGRPIRAQGTLGHYVVFAEMLMQVGCMAWALLLSARPEDFRSKVLLGVAFLAITAALLMTETRAAVGALVLGCLVSLLLLAKRTTRILAIGALILIVGGATLWIQHRRGTVWVDRDDISTQFRLMMWEDGLRLVRQHPWFGVGMETVRLHFQEWNIRAFMKYNVRSHFHSTFVQIAVERGIPALLAWLWFCTAYFLFLLRLIPRLRARSRFAAGVAVGALAGLIGFTFTSFFHYNIGEESLAMILFFYYGLAAAMDRVLTTPAAIDVA